MRYLMVSDFVADPDAGSAGSLWAIAATMRSRGHDVDVIWSEENKKTSPFLRTPHLKNLFDLPQRQLRQVENQLLKKTYDVVSISQPYAYLIYERLMPRYPNTIFLNRTHGWEERVDAAKFLWYSKGTLHSIASQARVFFTHKACERSLLGCHGIITASAKCRDFILHDYPSVRSKIISIPHGIHLSLTENSKPRIVEDSPLKLLYVGNYIPIKGSRELKAILPDIGQAFPECQLTFVVPHHQVELVKSIYSSSWGSRLNVMGWMERSKLKDVYNAHDILLYPSLFEGFGKAALEAMACGLCVIGYDEGGLSEATVNHKEAIYCSVGDRRSLKALLGAYLRYPKKIREIASNAQKAVLQCTWERSVIMIEQFCDYLKEMYFIPNAN